MAWTVWLGGLSVAMQLVKVGHRIDVVGLTGVATAATLQSKGEVAKDCEQLYTSPAVHSMAGSFSSVSTLNTMLSVAQSQGRAATTDMKALWLVNAHLLPALGRIALDHAHLGCQPPHLLCRA